jgi:hypothetical protein
VSYVSYRAGRHRAKLGVMNAKFSPSPATENNRAVRPGPDEAIVPGSSRVPGGACCCASKAAVQVIMPPSAARPHTTDLLLCGHHYRVSRRAMAAADATIRQLPDLPPDVAAWLDLGQPPARPGR